MNSKQRNRFIHEHKALVLQTAVTLRLLDMPMRADSLIRANTAKQRAMQVLVALQYRKNFPVFDLLSVDLLQATRSAWSKSLLDLIPLPPNKALGKSAFSVLLDESHQTTEAPDELKTAP